MEIKTLYPNLPAPEFIEKQTTCIGGDILIIGLTEVQAKAIVHFANDNGVKDSICSPAKFPLDDFQKGKLSHHFYVRQDSVEVYLGHTTKCHESLFQLLGLKI